MWVWRKKKRRDGNNKRSNFGAFHLKTIKRSKPAECKCAFLKITPPFIICQKKSCVLVFWIILWYNWGLNCFLCKRGNPRDDATCQNLWFFLESFKWTHPPPQIFGRHLRFFGPISRPNVVSIGKTQSLCKENDQFLLKIGPVFSLPGYVCLFCFRILANLQL